MEKIEVKRVVHEGYKELENTPYKIFGKYQYIYTSGKGKISLIKLINYFRDGKDLWEIYCLEGELFDDVERFDTKKEAVITIKNYLSNKEKKIKKITQSTPEQKEDKKLYIAVEDILSDYHIGVFTDAFYITKLVELFKNLLLEREREAEKNLLKRFYNATSKEEFRDVLDKLNKKK